MPLYVGFFSESSKSIMEAIHFVSKKIREDLDKKKQAVDPSHHKTVEAEYQKEIDRLNKTIVFLQNQISEDGPIYQLPEETNKDLMSVFRSAVEVYLKDIVKAKATTGLSGFDSKIQELRRLLNLEGLKTAKTDLFDKYYQAPTIGPEGKKIEIFLSYSNKDKIIAGKIAKILGDKGIDVFLAHEDIDVSQEWRIEILKHLNTASFVVSLLTDDYEVSTWANQEAGYMMGKGGKNISLIIGNTDIKKFGFLESLQGIAVEDEDFEGCADKIVELVLK